MLIHLCGGGRIGEGSHRCRFVEGITEHRGGRRLDHGIGEVGRDSAVDQDALGGAAHLAGIPIGTEDGGLRRCGEVGVGADDHGSVARGFHERALESRRAHDALGGGRRADESDGIDARVRDEVFADGAVTGDDGYQSLRDAGLLEQCAERETGERSRIRWLAHDGVASSERGAEELAHDHEREVPRSDGSPHADGGAVGEHPLVARRARDHLPVEPLGVLRGDREEGGRIFDIGERFRLVRLALLDRREACEFLVVILDEGCDAVAQIGALVCRPMSVVVPGTMGGGHGSVQLLGARARQVGEPLAGDGRDDGRRLLARVGILTGDPQA